MLVPYIRCLQPWRYPGSAPVIDSCGVAGGVLKGQHAASVRSSRYLILRKCTNAQTHKCTNAQMHKRTNAQMHKRTNAQIPKCSNPRSSNPRCTNSQLPNAQLHKRTNAQLPHAQTPNAQMLQHSTDTHSPMSMSSDCNNRSSR